MKHIFYIHSFITYIVSCSIISEQGIDKQDVLFLYGRKFSFPGDPSIQVVILSDTQLSISNIPSYGEAFLIFRHLPEIRSIDALLGNFIESEDGFTAYLPSTRNYLMQLIATHYKCLGLSFIEEGLMTYTGNFYKKTSPTYTSSWFGLVRRLIKFPYHANRSFYYRLPARWKKFPVYALTNGFGDLPAEFEVRVLSQLVLPEIDGGYHLENEHILFMQPTVEKGHASLQNLLTVLDILVSFLESHGVKNLYIKFHPEQKIQQAIEGHFRSSPVSLKIIPADVSAEAILSNSKELHVYGLFSSLLFYAAVWGHQALSLTNLLQELDAHFALTYAAWSIPTIYYDRVPLLYPDRKEVMNEKNKVSGRENTDAFAVHQAHPDNQ